LRSIFREKDHTLKFRIILFFILGFLFLNSLANTHARIRVTDWDEDEMPDTTTKRKSNPDSVRTARLHIADSMRDARERITDSAKYTRKHKADSVQTARKRVTDSTAAIRKHKESKHYKDSVTHARTAKTNALKSSRQAHLDSVKDARKAITDSTIAVRKERSDSIKSIQKHRTDSLARVKKYKTSKRYADSVEVVKRVRADSIKTAQKSQRDEIAAKRKKSLDSAKFARKKTMDSVKVVRTKSLDSVKLVRKHKTDSLAKAKKLKESLAKAKEKKKDEDKKIKLELKMKQKHEAWSNTSMLKKRWGPVRRVTQNSFTHYNYYYNAKKKMDEAQVNMQRTKKENYDSLIGLYPFDPNRDSSLLSSDMDTIIRKISVGIQIHDPRVKWSNDLYLLLGEAYYCRGQYDNAAIAFRYIISKDEEKKKKEAAKNGYRSDPKEGPSILEEDDNGGFLSFLKHKSVHNEAVLWLARTYTEGHQVENAESILSLLESDKNFPEDLKGRLAIEKAFAYLQENNYPAASTQLSIAMDDNNLPDWLRMRAAFIYGQLMQNMGQYKDAANSFENVLSYYPKIEMDFYARKYAALNRLQAGEDMDASMRPLKKVLSDGKYVNYYDQVYYALGNLAVKANDNKQAITYYTKSTTTPKATRKQKAISYAALGDVYYASANYPGAKRAYDSAAKYSSGSKDAGIAASQQRSKGLEEVAGPSKVIHDQDSLLALAALSKREQQSVVRRYLRDLEKRKADSIINAENAGVTALAPEPPSDGGPDPSNWYFGSTTAMQQGSAEFKKKWGNRPLTDNWRRAAGNPFAGNAGSAEEDLGGAETASTDNGEITEESLLAKIPNTPQQKELAIKMEQRAYLQLAKAYIKQLEDYNMAIQTMDSLDSKFPNHNQKEEELYLRYQIALKQNKLDKAKGYADELLSKYPKSQYASSVRPKQSESKADATFEGKTVAAYFDETYKLLLQHQYTEVLMRTSIAKKQYDNPVYQKRFELVEAMALAGSNDFDLADTMVNRFIHTYPGDTLVGWANTIKNYIKEVRNGGKPSWYKEGPLPGADNALAKDTKAGPVVAPPVTKPTPPPPISDIPSAYSFRSDTDHYCIIVLPGIDSRTSGLKMAVRDFNTAKYPSAGLELLFDLYNIDQGVLLVKKFPSSMEAKKYMDDLQASNALKGYSPGELQLMLISGQNYKKMFADKDVKPYKGFYDVNYK
jgi:tetratricopeptide (TPR) repeat protein